MSKRREIWLCDSDNRNVSYLSWYYAIHLPYWWICYEFDVS